MAPKMPAVSSFVALLLLGSAYGHNPCECKFQGKQLPKDVYNNYPSDNPGKYSNMEAIHLYGTMCAAWDQVVSTPWASYCPNGSDWSHADYNWCQQPWCYVDEDCPSAVPSSVFNGSEVAFYSYLSCGSTANCYSNIAWNASYSWPAGCPYDPHGTGSYKVHEKGSCACKFQGQNLSSNYYTNYPSDEPGKYKNMSSIQYYGTTCAAWDQLPGTPWHSYCPAGAEWCHPDYNWCQLPWCYVDSSCASAVASSVFKGSDAAFYSYDTCLDTPNCYTDVAWDANALKNAPAACPFDYNDNKWMTAKTCDDWSNAPPTTCGDVKAAYKKNECCGAPGKAFTTKIRSV